MAFKAKLNVGGQDFNVLSFSYGLKQETDATGRPSSVTRGGMITCTIESTENTSFFEWMTNSFENKAGEFTLYKRDSEATLKKLTFTEAYLVSYKEDFDSTGTNPLKETFTMSAREIGVGNGEHTNEWV